MPISLVLDIIISVLLVLTIAYAVRLNQRLSQLRSDKNELLQLAKTFADATTRAEAGIANLKVSSDALQAEVAKAAALKDDLAYLVERGGRSADEMVANVRTQPRAAQGNSRVTQGNSRAAFDDTASAGGPGEGAPRRGGPDARLIEDAIRAASAHNAEPKAGDRAPAREDRAALTRRISGAASGGASGGGAGGGSGRTPGALASRGLGLGGGRNGERDFADMHDDDAIEDTQAARELLKALSAVK